MHSLGLPFRLVVFLLWLVTFSSLAAENTYHLQKNPLQTDHSRTRHSHTSPLLGDSPSEKPAHEDAPKVLGFILVFKKATIPSEFRVAPFDPKVSASKRRAVHEYFKKRIESLKLPKTLAENINHKNNHRTASSPRSRRGERYQLKYVLAADDGLSVIHAPMDYVKARETAAALKRENPDIEEVVLDAPFQKQALSSVKSTFAKAAMSASTSTEMDYTKPESFLSLQKATLLLQDGTTTATNIIAPANCFLAIDMTSSHRVGCPWYFNPLYNTVGDSSQPCSLQSITSCALFVHAGMNLTKGLLHFEKYYTNVPPSEASTRIVVGVLDSGYTFHPDLIHVLVDPTTGATQLFSVLAGFTEDNPSSGYNALLHKNDAFDTGTQCETENTKSNWHGTAVSALIAGLNQNKQGIMGVNPFSLILPVRTLGKCGGSNSTIMYSLYWLLSSENPYGPQGTGQLKVINMSLGSKYPAMCDSVTQNILDRFHAAGISVVVSSGNESSSSTIYSPGNCRNVITTAALDYCGTYASYSNVGENVDFSAPGGSTLSFARKNNCATNIPSKIPYAAHRSTGDFDGNLSYTYSEAGGTSFSAPLIAGVLSVIYTISPTLTADQAYQILQESSRSIHYAFQSNLALEGKCTASLCGHGVPDLEQAILITEAYRDGLKTFTAEAGASNNAHQDAVTHDWQVYLDANIKSTNDKASALPLFWPLLWLGGYLWRRRSFSQKVLG